MVAHQSTNASGPRPDQPTSVYRYYDEYGALLYVGITSRGAQRNTEHNISKVWWQFVVRQEVDHYETRGAAAVREVELIAKFRPPFNTQHNPGYLATREAYLLFREAAVGERVGRAKHRIDMVQHSQSENGKDTVLRSVAPAVDLGVLSMPPKLRTISDKRKYGTVVKAWIEGPFLMIRLHGYHPPIIAARARINIKPKGKGTYLDGLFIVPEFHVPRPAKSPAAR